MESAHRCHEVQIASSSVTKKHVSTLENHHAKTADTRSSIIRGSLPMPQILTYALRLPPPAITQTQMSHATFAKYWFPAPSPEQNRTTTAAGHPTAKDNSHAWNASLGSRAAPLE